MTLWPFKGKRRKKRLFVLGIDGVPYSLAQEAFGQGRLANLEALAKEGDLVRMNSVIPVVSATAWATFSTGVNPAKHGITGFVDRDPHLNYVLLTSAHFKAKSLWQRLNEHGKRVVALNVPGTYPPESVNGIIVGDFLCPSLDKAAHPASLAAKLQEIGYLIDPDPRLAHTDKEAFLEEVFQALAARRELALRLLDSEGEEWDLFMLHVMETDRINHFYWDAKDDPGHRFHRDFWAFYERVDALIGELAAALAGDGSTELMVLSDHGFCALHQEVDLNRYLRDLGYLRFKPDAEALSDIDPSSRAYSLTPGRIHLNLKGREAAGSVDPHDAPRLRRELKQALSQLKDPTNGRRVIARIYEREELYRGPLLERCAELIAHPVNGYDLKASVGNDTGDLFRSTAHTGMHTYEGALVTVRGRRLRTDDSSVSIVDITPTIFELLELSPPEEFEGRSLLSH